ncbi:uncharacterized protein [Fopius arisanus]|uniref:Little elongation complex subunit 2 C-terminal domain-containing protein n=1 Tax=Fopius arisanus TaxID=64838 RepID=A0A9R1SX66_9HYME|nr:PREDICTED: uncharacterized protein LOC105263951 [Fopius arisanus]
MDIFNSIDWNPSINDIIDNEFVDGERLERESAMYRILRGTFTDPFIDAYEDFKGSITQVDIDANEKQKQAIIEEKNKIKETTVEEGEAGKHAKYYPGIRKTKAKFPRFSSLSADQHSACLRVLLQFSAPGKPDISKINREDLEMYTRLQSVISEEQTEFLKVAKSNWDGSEVKLIREDLINRKWKFKMKYIEQIPRHYVEAGTIPFICDKEISVCFNAVALEMGKLPRLIIPELVRPTYLPVDSQKLEKTYFSFPEPQHQKNLITEDLNCDKIIEAHDIDLVISSSGLNCLCSNLDSSYKSSWALPVTVREVNNRKVILVDKPLPPQARNIIQKNSWISKYIIRSFLLNPRHNSSVKLDQRDEFDLDAPQEENQPEGLNFSYNIFSIGSCGLQQNELMKNKVERDYRLLVRTKTDGIEKLSNNQVQYIITAPKMEHQLGLGAEAVTLEEASRQWAALTFRPDTTLLRVRASSWNQEVIQYERRTAISVNNEIKRLYNVKGEDSLQLLYNVAENMSKMTPGKYLIRHTPRNGAFASIYKEAEASGKNTIDLQAIYCDDQFQTIPNLPWPMIDKVVPLPMHECFNRMPALFHPDKKLFLKSRRNPPKNQKTPKKRMRKKGKKTEAADTSAETTT